MLDYALANGRSIGMIQPTEKHRDSKIKKKILNFIRLVAQVILQLFRKQMIIDMK